MGRPTPEIVIPIEGVGDMSAGGGVSVTFKGGAKAWLPYEDCDWIPGAVVVPPWLAKKMNRKDAKAAKKKIINKALVEVEGAVMSKHDAIAEKLDELVDLGEYWKRRRADRGPCKAIRAAMLLVVKEIQALQNLQGRTPQDPDLLEQALTVKDYVRQRREVRKGGIMPTASAKVSIVILWEHEIVAAVKAFHRLQRKNPEPEEIANALKAAYTALYHPEILNGNPFVIMSANRDFFPQRGGSDEHKD